MIGFITPLHAFATLYMVGLIWFVQLVHYPLMGKVGEPEFVEYEKLHVKYTGWAVGPAMLVEVATATCLIFLAGDLGYSPVLAWIGFALVVLIWVSTAALQIPCHRTLEAGFDPAAHRRLVRTNWIRTIAWTARGVLVCLAMT